MPPILKENESQVAVNHTSESEEPKVKPEKPPAFKSKIERLLEQAGFRRRNTLLGLDIGSSGIKMVEVNKTKKGWRLVNAGIVEFDSSGLKSSKADTPGKLALSLKSALREFRITAKNVAFSVSGSDSLQRFITLPQMPKKELNQVLTWEVKKYVDLPSDQLSTDYIVRPKPADSTDNLDIFVVSIPQKKVEESITLINSVGLKCAVLETRSTALTGAVLELAPEFCQKTFAILDIGHRTSLVNIAKEGFLSFTREIEWGGENLTLALCNKLGYDRSQAEVRKKEVGLSEGEGKRGTDSSEEWTNVAKILEEEIDYLIQEVAKSFEYYSAQFSEGEIGELLLTGGGSGLTGLQTLFTQRFKMNVRLFDPSSYLLPVEDTEAQKYMQQICGRLSVALGLSTRRR